MSKIGGTGIFFIVGTGTRKNIFEFVSFKLTLIIGFLDVSLTLSNLSEAFVSHRIGFTLLNTSNFLFIIFFIKFVGLLYDGGL